MLWPSIPVSLFLDLMDLDMSFKLSLLGIVVLNALVCILSDKFAERWIVLGLVSRCSLTFQTNEGANKIVFVPQMDEDAQLVEGEVGKGEEETDDRGQDLQGGGEGTLNGSWGVHMFNSGSKFVRKIRLKRK